MTRFVAMITVLAPLFAVPSWGQSPQGFVCPYQKPGGAPKSAPTLTAEYFSGATDVTADKRLPILIYDMRQSGMSPSEMVDHLVGGYCPLVAAASGLTDQQKTQMVRRFARQVAGLAYVPSQQDETAILVDVPLPPTLFDEISQSASKAGISRDAWIENAVKRALATQ